LETLLKNMPQKTLDKMQQGRIDFVMAISNLCMTTNFMYQVGELQAMLDTKNYFAPAYQWILFTVSLILTFLFYCRGKKNMVYYLIQTITLRQSFALMDFEGRRFRKTAWELQQFVLIQSLTVYCLIVCMNLIVGPSKMRLVSNFVNFLTVYIGGIIINQKEKFSFLLLGTLILENIVSLIMLAFSVTFSVWLIGEITKMEKYNLLMVC
jgi:hypothetical protein